MTTQTTSPTFTIRNDFDVKLHDYMGTDMSIADAARVSTLGRHVDEADHDRDAGLINFLMKNRHGTPFEHNAMTFFVSAPIFVFREFHRHRVGFSYNEMSGRYTQLEPTFYVPNPNRPLVQQGKPGHYVFIPGNTEQGMLCLNMLTSAYAAAWQNYEIMLDEGIAKEVARACLPVGIYSNMYVTCNARSLMNFLSLRTKEEGSKFPSYPQYEIEQVARGMEKCFSDLFPITYNAFNNNGRVAP